MSFGPMDRDHAIRIAVSSLSGTRRAKMIDRLTSNPSLIPDALRRRLEPFKGVAGRRRRKGLRKPQQLSLNLRITKDGK
jgi:hypothetical protein